MNIPHKLLLLICIHLFFISTLQAQDATLFTRLQPKRTGIDFKNELTESLDQNIIAYEYFFNGGGIAAGDINNDGLTDLYFTGNMVDCRLYLNRGNLKFEDITQKAGVAGHAGWKTGATMADVNGDGFIDIYLCYSGKGDSLSRRHQLFINQGNGTFKDEAEKYGLALMDYSTQAAFFDYDLDGDLDVFMLNHSPETMRRFDAADQKSMRDHYIGDKLLRNDNEHFTDVSEQANIKGNPINFGLGVAVSDFNNDGWPDFYVSNDYLEQDYFYINNGNGTFTDKLTDAIGHVSYFSMGNDAADFNNDGLIDLMTLDMLPPDNLRQKLLFAPENYEFYQNMVKKQFYHQQMRNMLQMNNGDGTFSEIGQYAGVSNTDWSWGPLFADLDNDGLKDLLVASGYPRDLISMEFQKFYADERMKANQGEKNEKILQMLQQVPSTPVQSFMFRNNGDLTFSDMAKQWGFGEKTFTNGLVCADLDNDGDLDVVVNRLNNLSAIYQNNEKHSHYLDVQLINRNSANRFGIGARVILSAGGKKQVQEFYPTRGFQSAMHTPLHFGTTEDFIDTLIVIWPDGKMETLTRLKTDQKLTLLYEEAHESYARPPMATPAFVPATDVIKYVNREDEYNDFKQQPLLPNMVSYRGPRCATGDVNSDGLTDIYFCGAKNLPPKLFIQAAGGTFTESPQEAFQMSLANHDADALLFDADGDGDSDLYVVSGGYQIADGDSLLQDRIYFNEGGIFSRNKKALPKETASGSCVKAADLDGDGDLDLFVGGRVVPGRYPESPRSFIMLNDGKGNFTDATDAIAPALKNIGMVTDAVWTDVNKDRRPDLVVAGEWMPVKIFINENGKLTDASDQWLPQKSSGWWSRIAATDFDHDGDMDLIIGNAGGNFQMKVSEQEPAEMYYADFDNNGSMDPVIFYYIQDTLRPLASRDEMLDQMISLRKKFPDYYTYAKATVNDILTPEQQQQAGKLEAVRFETSCLENKGDHFEFKPLPAEAQFAPVAGITVLDYDGDGIEDVILGGNVYHSRIRFGKMDANYGMLLRGDGRGRFTYVPQWQSGLSVHGDVCDIVNYKNDSGSFLIFAINQQAAKAYKLNRK